MQPVRLRRRSTSLSDCTNLQYSTESESHVSKCQAANRLQWPTIDVRDSSDTPLLDSFGDPPHFRRGIRKSPNAVGHI